MGARIIENGEIGISWVMDEPMARASHALADGEKVWLVDPVDDEAALERPPSLGDPAVVFQLLDRHNRDCAEVARRLGIDLVVLPLELRGTPFEAIEVVDNRFWKERALWWKKTRTLIVAEAIGASRMFNPCAAGAGTHIGLRAAPPRKQLGTYNPKHLLMGHGDPISGKQATVALQEALDRSRRDLPGNLLKIPFAFR
ncbi:MAG TPA: hypothetical protein PKD76_01160 [Solirubrobacterales bacterium]|nr:hypothetical protein [Solirubrobacterales bacterium]